MIIAALLPKGHIFPGTLHMLFSYVDDEDYSVRRYYCSKHGIEVSSKSDPCPQCKNTDNVGYFLQFSLDLQLKLIMSDDKFLENVLNFSKRVKENKENIEDIQDGEIFKELKGKGFFKRLLDFSLSWYTDGFQLFRSSKYNLWPFYFTINNIPFRFRRVKENVMIAVIWFGKQKPIANLILKHIYDDIIKLFNGVNVTLKNDQTVVVKSIVTGGSADLDAKAIFGNNVRWNGNYACQICYQRGELCSSRHVFPYRRAELRTDEEAQQHAREAFETGVNKYGKKGTTYMYKIAYNYTKSSAIDFMHNVFEGHFPYLLDLLFDSEFAASDFSLRDKLHIADQMIREMNAPHYLKIIPRSIEEYSEHLKANEMKAFFFFYSLPIFERIMSQQQFDCFKLLVLGVTLLNRPSISRQMLVDAEEALTEYNKQFGIIYGIKYMPLNIHLLRHLSLSVLRNGPLYMTGCFGDESFLGFLKSHIHGSKDPQLQLCKSIMRYMSFSRFKSEHLDENSQLYKTYQKLSSKSFRMKLYTLYDSTHIVGKPRSIAFSELESQVSNALEIAEIGGERYFVFYKLLKDTVLFFSKSYPRQIKTNSTCATYLEDGKTKIGIIHSFLLIYNCSCGGICECEMRVYALINKCYVKNCFNTVLNVSIPTLYKQRSISSNLTVIDVKKLKSVCFYMPIEENVTYIAEPVNTYELE